MLLGASVWSCTSQISSLSGIGPRLACSWCWLYSAANIDGVFSVLLAGRLLFLFHDMIDAGVIHETIRSESVRILSWAAMRGTRT